MASSAGNPGSDRSGRWWRRSLVALLVTGVFVALFGKWLIYRQDHVVSRDAVVRGVISRIGSGLEGRVAQVLVQADQRVRKGDVLARLEDAHLRASLDQAQSEFERAQQELEIARQTLTADRDRLGLAIQRAEVDILAAEADVTLAEASLARFEREVKRLEKIDRPGTLTGSEIDEIRSQADIGRAQLARAQSADKGAHLLLEEKKQDLAQLELRENYIKLLEKSVDVARSKVDAAQAGVEAAVILAPEDGWVAQRVAEAGSGVRVGDPIVTLWTGDRLWVEAWVDESDLDKLQLDSRVDVHLAAYPNQRFEGQVHALGVLSDSALRESAMPVSRRTILPTNREVGFFGEPSKVAVRVGLNLDPNVRVMPGLTAMVGIRSPEDARADSSPNRLMAMWHSVKTAVLR